MDVGAEGLGHCPEGKCVMPEMRVLGYVRKEMLDLCKVANNAAALTVVPNAPKSGRWVAIYVDKDVV